MAKAPGSVNGWDGGGNVWFKIGETGASISAGKITWPAQGEYFLVLAFMTIDGLTFNN